MVGAVAGVADVWIVCGLGLGGAVAMEMYAQYLYALLDAGILIL